MATEKQLREFGRLICQVADGIEMTRETACEAYRQIILNEQPELQQGAFLMAHIARGPTVAELSGAWDALDRYDTAKIQDLGGDPVCDIVGTGSDALKTVNCSTPAALIASACGLKIAKKGARLVTGVSGASDVMEILGIDLNAPLSKAEESLHQNGLCYLPGEAFLRSGWARLITSMRFTSAFNIIGPLTRPCPQTDSIVIGAYSPTVCDQLVDVLREIGMGSALAPYGMVQGEDETKGMDEFSPCGKTRVVELKDGEVRIYHITPEDFGIKTIAFDQVASRNTAIGNAKVVREVLRERHEGPEADFFCMNAAAALYTAGRVESYRKGMAMAREALQQGSAYAKLQALISCQGAA